MRSALAVVGFGALLAACEQAPGELSSARLVWTPETLDFGEVPVGGIAWASAQLVNEGASEAHVSLPPLEPPFTLQDAPHELRLPPGAAVVFGFGFAPTAEGAVRFEPTVGTEPFALVGTGVAPPVIEISPERIGKVSTIAPARRPVTVFNRGSSALVVDGIDAPSSIGISELPGDPIPPGGSDRFMLEFGGGPRPPSVIRIYSNDPRTPVLALPVDWSGTPAFDCQARFPTGELDFGLVQVGRSVLLDIDIDNTEGVQPCVVVGAEVVMGAEHWQSPLSELWVESGDRGRLPLRFTPTSSGPIEGRVQLAIGDPARPTRAIELRGQGTPSDLLVAPGRLDFGLFDAGCRPSAATVLVHNQGDATSSLRSLRWAEGSSFALERYPAPLPGAALEIGPRQSIELPVRFLGGDAAAYADTLRIEFEGLEAPLELPVQAAVEDEPWIEDGFVMPALPKVDVLLVLDPTQSMADRQEGLRRNLKHFVEYYDAAGFDYRIALTTTDLADEGRILSGTSFAAVDSSTRGPAERRIVSRDTPDPVRALLANSAIELRPDTAAAESGLAAAARALSAARLSELGSAFLRPQAALAVIIISDAPDRSPGSVDGYLDAVRAARGFRGEDHSSISAVVAPYPAGRCTGAGGEAVGDARYVEAANGSGGALISICTPDWSRALEWYQEFPRRQWRLSRMPVVSTLEVRVDGALLPAQGPQETVYWRHDAVHNRIVFAPYATPAPGASLRVRYVPGCD